MAPAIIAINGNLVHHAAQKEGGAHFAPDASETNYLIMQCFSPLDEAQRERLKELDVDVQQFISGDTYFCRYEPQDLTPLRSLPFVHFANPYHPHYVAETSFKAKLLHPSDEERHKVHVTPHHDHKSAAALEALKQKIARQLNIDATDVIPQTGYFRMLIEPQNVSLLAGLDEIRSISEAGEGVPFNWTARDDLNVPSPSFKTFPSHNDLTGEGEIVAVADMGMDINHPAFVVEVPVPGKPKQSSSYFSRIIRVASWRQNSDSKVSKNDYNVIIHGQDPVDTGAHGTHVAGSVAGNWFSPTLNTPILGTVPKAQLVCQVLFEENGVQAEYPAHESFQTVINDAKNWGAKTHTNSYGARVNSKDKSQPPSQKLYPSEAVDVDNSAWNNRDMTILFAAGNFGDRGDRGVPIGSQASAKNCITVGACEASHPLFYDADLPREAPRYRYDPERPRGNPDRLAYFSSQGPTESNSRIKPDVVAPGVNIYSARSQTAKGVGKGSLPFDLHGAAPDDLFFFQCGTSMATPLVAGCCAVIRKALLTCVGGEAISSAMVKAVLINGTTDMTASGVPQQRIKMDGASASHQMALAPAPSPGQGFGRVNLAKSLLCVPNYPKPYGGVFPLDNVRSAVVGTGKQNIDRICVPITIPSPPSTTGTTLGPLQPRLTVTMCYTDAPGVENVGALQNTLVLGVTYDQVADGGAVTKVVRYGNKNPTDTEPDKLNNVQKVVWPNFPAQKASAIVKCMSISQGLVSADPLVARGQDFALAWYVEWDDLSNNSVYKFYNSFSTSANAVLYATPLR